MSHKIIELGWHAANLFAYHIDKETGEVKYFLDQKDSRFKTPYFNSGLNAPGGNYLKGKHNFVSPDDIIYSEISQEFYASKEEDENLGFVFKEDVQQVGSKELHSGENMQRISQIVPILLEGIEYLGTAITRYNLSEIKLVEPAMATSLYSKALSNEEYAFISELVNKFDSKLSTDSLKFGGANRFVSMRDFPTSRFAYDCSSKLLKLLNLEKLPMPKERNVAIPVFVGVQITEFIDKNIILEDHFKTGLGTPTFEAFEGPLGFRYRVYSK